MQYLCAPWRMEYILSNKSGKCFICHKYEEQNDEKNMVLYRTDSTVVLLNQYPYNNGHLMVSPSKHVSDLSLLSPEEVCELFLIVQSASMIIQKKFTPEGLNIGINVGKAGGAGLEDHLHVHLLPRWQGDSNFMSTVCETRTIPESLERTYKNLLPYFRNPNFFKGLDMVTKHR